MLSVTPDGLWMVSDRIVKSRFYVKFHRFRTSNNFHFFNYHGACYLSMKKAPNQAKDLIKMVSVTPDGFWMVSDRIFNSCFFVKFHRSGSAIIFSFSNIMEHVSYPSRKLLIKPKTSSRWWVLLRKDYGWFLIELSIFNFSSNFTGPDLQKFSVFELLWSTLVIHQKSS